MIESLVIAEPFALSGGPASAPTMMVVEALALVDTPETPATVCVGEPFVLVVQAEPQVVALVSAGDQGPTGAAFNEDDAVYAKRVDMFGESLIYRGEAAVGTADAQPLWRIRRITIGSDGDVIEEWSGGTASFDKVWADRVALGYS